MILAPHDAALFYRAWGALLTWVNDRRHIVPRFERPGPERGLEPALALPIRKVIWAEDGLREQFLVEGAAELPQAERDLIASWADRVSGSFVILRHLQNHTIFMGKQVYGVVGIYSPLAEMFPYVPMFVEAVLLPFRDVIITDGLIQSPGMQLSFGGGARRMFDAEYSEKAKSGVRTRLGPPAQSGLLDFSVAAWPARRPKQTASASLPHTTKLPPAMASLSLPTTRQEIRATTRQAAPERATGVAAKKSTTAERATGVAAKKAATAERATGVAAKKSTTAERATGVAAKKSTIAKRAKKQAPRR